MSATLQDIRLKVRRITKSPNANQITDQQIDDYVNNFYIYDFPEHLRLFQLREIYEFTLQPNIADYPTPVSEAIPVGPSSAGNISGTPVFVNLLTLLGVPTGARIVPGSILISVGAPAVATFTEVFPYTGQLVGSGAGISGLVDYTTGDTSLDFSSAIASSPLTVRLEYQQNEYITFHPPLYIAGYESYYSQSRSEFYRIYPINRNIEQIASGDGTTGPFTAIASASPILRNNVLINTLDTTNAPLSLTDDGAGFLVGDGTGTVNYLTGAVNFTFTNATLPSEDINLQTVPYVAARPQAMLLYDETFTFRPVPDQAYTVTIEVYKRPTQLLLQSDIPKLKEWWQFLAMGAAMKIFEDRGDFPNLQQYRPIFDEYRQLAERRTIVQQTNDRTATIYTAQSNAPVGNFYGAF